MTSKGKLNSGDMSANFTSTTPPPQFSNAITFITSMISRDCSAKYFFGGN